MKKIFGFFLLTTICALKINAGPANVDETLTSAGTIYESYSATIPTDEVTKNSESSVTAGSSDSNESEKEELFALAKELIVEEGTFSLKDQNPSEEPRRVGEEAHTYILFPRYGVTLPIANERIEDFGYAKYLYAPPSKYEIEAGVRALSNVNPLVLLSLMYFGKKHTLPSISSELITFGGFKNRTHLVREIQQMGTDKNYLYSENGKSLERALLEHLTIYQSFETIQPSLKNELRNFTSLPATEFINKMNILQRENKEAQEEEQKLLDAKNIFENLTKNPLILKSFSDAVREEKDYISIPMCGKREFEVWKLVSTLSKDNSQFNISGKEGSSHAHNINSVKAFLSLFTCSCRTKELIQDFPWMLTIKLLPEKTE